MVTEDLVKQYQSDGAIAVRNVISAEWLERLGSAIERDIANPGPFDHSYDVAGGRFHGNLRLWEIDPDFGEFCLSGPGVSIAQSLLDASRLNLLYDQLFVKEAGADHPTRWHNDQPYWPVLGRQVVSFWLALDPTDLDNGGLEFVAGSHLWDRWFQPESFGKTNASVYERNPDYEAMPDIEAERDDHSILSWSLEPGDVLAFSAMTVHGAPANLDGSRRRRGYTVRYTGDDAVYQETIGMSRPLFTDTLNNGDPIGGPQYPQLI